MSEITVLMPVYNGMPYLRQAIQSLLDQTLPDWHCVVVDDGSTDGTREFLDAIDDDRFAIIHQENAGVAAAINCGLERCNTRYIARLDADDVALPTRLADQSAFLDAHPDVGLVGAQVAPMGEFGVGQSLKLPLNHDQIMSDLMAGRHGVAHSSIMLRADVLRQVGGYWAFPLGEEYDLMLRIGEIAQLANLSRVLLHYRFHTGSHTANSLRRTQFYNALASESARRRRAGLPAITPDEFQAQRDARPWWRLVAETIEIHARTQYRIALAERFGGRPWRGAARLAWAAACSPRLTIERMVRVLRHGVPAQGAA